MMRSDGRSVRPHVLWGALYGVAAWSAYAVVEALFTSVVFRFTRPYATYTAWHWSLNALVAGSYIVCGAAIGLLTGLVTWRVARRQFFDPALSAIAASVVLTAALLVNMATGSGAVTGGAVQVAAASLFLFLEITALLAPNLRNRFEWLINPWIVSVTWLALGLLFYVMRLRLGPQLGKRTDLAATIIVALLALLVLAAALAGFRRNSSTGGAWQPRLSVGSAFACIVLIVVSLGLSAGFASVAEARSSDAAGASTRPNLLLIVMDTVRADHLSLHGYSRDTTPHLKQLAADSVLYRNAFTASDITLTSHASLFTGMYPSWHGSYSRPPEAPYGHELSPQYPTLAEVLGRNGYDTLGAAANLYLRADFGLERGFQSFRIPRPVPILPDEQGYMLRYPLRRALSYVADTSQFDRLYSFAEDINRELFELIESRPHLNSPFFAFVNYMDAHYPYVPPAPFDRKYPGKNSHMTPDDLGVDIDLISRGQGQPPDYRQHCVSQYDGGIAYLDQQIGDAVSWLKRHGLYDNTMIVVTSDHGESFGEKNRVGHANSPYQNLLHTSLLIKYPGAKFKGVEENPVSLIDVAPTALTALGVPVPSTMQGAPLGSAAPAARHIYAETFANPVSHSPDCPEGCATKVIVEWPLKYIANLTNGRPEFYDLSTDPNEQHNLFVTQRDRAAQIAADLTQWSTSLPAQQVHLKKLNLLIENGLRGNGYIAK